jgi:DNA-binding beta-propeller fold protein YncE
MKRLSCLFLLLLCRAAAQNPGAGIIEEAKEDIRYIEKNDTGKVILQADDEFRYIIYRNPDGSKTFLFSVYQCPEYGNLALVNLTAAPCLPLSRSEALSLEPVQEAIGDFLNDGSNAPHRIVYSQLSSSKAPSLPVRQAQASPAPAQMVLLDTYSTNRIVKVDLTTYAIVSQVNLPSEPSAFAFRPVATGPANEVWIAHAAGTSNTVTVVDLSAGKLLATIQTSSVAPNFTFPAGIVFTNDGATALCAVRYNGRDAAGNLGALLSYDVATRKLVSTLLLKVAPTSLLMAPDGLTAYIVDGQGGNIAYYDVLSGTADLTVTRLGGFTGPAFLHPDGTRLFWDAGQLEIFDLTTRKIVSEFKFGLPTTSATTMNMSQDGSRVFVGNGSGAVVVMDTRYGNILAKFQAPGPAQVFGAHPGN